MMDRPRIAVVIPALDEQSAIGHVLGSLPAFVETVVVVDNGSTDDTAAVARGHGAIVVREPRRGYGAACLRGLAALDRPDIVVFLDADNSADPGEMPALVGPITRGEAEVVIGSRALGCPEQGSLTWPQRFGNALAAALIRRIWGRACTDLGPFRAILYVHLLALGMSDLDYGWTVQMQARAYRYGLRVHEAPVRYRKRIGRSKISGTVRGVLGAGTKILFTIYREALSRKPPAPSFRHLLVFTRYPEPGRVKTRMVPALGPDGAADLQRAMTCQTLTTAMTWNRRAGDRLTVLFDGGSESAMGEMFGRGTRYEPQGPGGLGERLYRAFNAANRGGAQRIVAIGSDCPSIDADVLNTAFDALETHDVVVGPAFDGGYYLIGVRTPRPELFDGIDWGTNRVMEQSRAIFEQLGLRVAYLEERSDVDVPADLPIWNSLRRGLANQLDPAPYLTVIIPTLNEEDRVSDTLESVGRQPSVEVIVVDGGSADLTRAIAEDWGARVIPAGPGRAAQMNAGAAIARGEVLLFLHADTRLPFGYLHGIQQGLANPAVCGGAFRFALDDTSAALRLVEIGANLRSKWLGLPFGDQALFVRKQVFDATGGFADLPVMEDYDLVRRLRKHGRIAIVPPAAITSARRWNRSGVLRTSANNLLLILGWNFGIQPDRLAKWRAKAIEAANTPTPPPGMSDNTATDASRPLDSRPK